MKRYILIIITLSILAPVSAQDNDTVKHGMIRDFSFIPLPVLAYSPATAWMFGLAPGISWFMGDPSTTNISSGLASIIYTTQKQWIITAKTNVFWKDDSWNLLGDWRYFITSQPTYGLGTGPQSGKPVGTGIEYEDGLFSEPIPTAQMIEFNYFRFHETVLKRIQESRFFVGAGYHLDIHSKINDNLLELDSVPPVITSHYAYQTYNNLPTDNYILSGISLNALFDSRDNAINPYSGRYAFVNIRLNPEFLGSDRGSSILWLEYRDYFNLSKERPRHMLAIWTYGWFVTSGKPPYLDLPAVGWDQFGRSGRAYPQGRFRGEDLIYGELEYRVPLQREKNRFGAVLFINATTASNRDGDIQLFDYLDYGYGVGLRVMVNKKSRANLALDYAFGKYGASGFYLGINEVF